MSLETEQFQRGNAELNRLRKETDQQSVNAFFRFGTEKGMLQ